MHPEETRIYIALLIGYCTISAMILFYIITVVKHRQENLTARHEAIIRELNLLEEDRKRIAMDIHDNIGAALFGLKFKVGAIPVVTPEAAKSIREACISIDSLLEEVKIVSDQLLPAVLQQQGLKAALIELLMPFIDSGEYMVSYKLDIPSSLLSGTAAIHIYRMMQELINNIKKHAEADKLNFIFYARNNVLYFLVEDNGKGFELEGARRGNRMGLRNIRMRADILNAKMYLSSLPGKGTTYRFEMPVPEIGEYNEEL